MSGIHARKQSKINRTDKLNSTYDGAFGNLSVRRGTGKCGTSLWSWDAIQPCRGDRCPAASQCEFLTKERIRHDQDPEKCKVMAGYLRSVSTTILGNYEGKLNEGQLFRVGMHIIPLYKNLVKMKIEELGIERVVTANDKGTNAVNPLYKEIREYIKLIEQMWKSVGIAGSVAGGEPVFGPDGEDGDENFYEQMEKEAFADVHQQRGRKLSLIRRT